MMRFRFTQTAIDTTQARRELLDLGAGGYVSFEGWVRDHNEGQEVTRLEYEAFQELGVRSAQRGEGLDAGRFIIDEVKHRVPIWKKEHYRSGDSGWVNCERCAVAPSHTHEHEHEHEHHDEPAASHT